MGKTSAVMILLLMINIVGYMLMYEQISLGYAATNPYTSGNNLLTTLYTPVTDVSGATIYVLNNQSALYASVPQTPPASFIENVGQFIDRIFILFDFIRVIIGVLLFPVALVSYMGLGWQLSMLLTLPLTALYVLGLIDLFSGGDS